MVRRQASADTEEPENSNFKLPSEDMEHLFQVVDKWTDKKDNNVVVAKLEVVGGDEQGRTILHRVNTDDGWKGFYFTRLFLKAIGEPYKGTFTIDDDNWLGRQFYGTVVHSGKYANINDYNFEKMVEQVDIKPNIVKPVDEEIAWDSDIK